MWLHTFYIDREFTYLHIPIYEILGFPDLHPLLDAEGPLAVVGPAVHVFGCHRQASLQALQDPRTKASTSIYICLQHSASRL